MREITSSVLGEKFIFYRYKVDLGPIDGLGVIGDVVEKEYKDPDANSITLGKVKPLLRHRASYKASSGEHIRSS